ncbi:hypothetical protein ACIPYS_06770 [Kitasatospora sp. NPDC089913]|uniref:hypothetical protein n=1 Tax=Streptomycetaceae TaxID=2062 RepID=UPI00087D870C|nr:hypothetical protein [Streptomyces sp. TLI_053]SDT82514.1 hypothetical protein SAMN05216371_7303 [Streptomyces sp. TLI_053]
MTWLRVLTAVGILAAAASALLVFALCTAAGRGDRIDRGDPDGDLRSDAERSGLIRRMTDGS